jgi:beta-galactosidase/beta-glucuronidase
MDKQGRLDLPDNFFCYDKELSIQQMELVFEGLDTHASVKLNDKEILSADNMFRTWVVDVKEHLKKGKTPLKFISGVLKIQPGRGSKTSLRAS